MPESPLSTPLPDDPEVTRLILQSLQGIKPRHRDVGARIASAFARSEPLASAYAAASERGDRRFGDALLFTTVGFMTEYMEQSRLVAVEMLAILLSRRNGQSSEGAWCQALLDTMAKMGILDPGEANRSVEKDRSTEREQLGSTRRRETPITHLEAGAPPQTRSIPAPTRGLPTESRGGISSTRPSGSSSVPSPQVGTGPTGGRQPIVMILMLIATVLVLVFVGSLVVR